VRSGPVIVGTDGDASARDAVALGNRLADLLEAPLDVITVSSSSPAEALRDAAAAEDAALVVLGPTHRRSMARTLRGTARRLLAEAPCPVAVAPAGFGDRPEAPLQRIGVGYEPTPEGAHALAEAHALAARAGGSLRAIGVVLPLAPLAYDDFGDVTPYLENEYRVVEAGLERALAQLPVTVPSIPDARVGDPAVELAAASAELDLLVCGTRRRSPLRAVVLGSVTERLLHGARCPLLIVPRSENYGSTHGTHRVRSATCP
jgi:nucleotide-binding universal stress UspA family protein